MRKETKRKCFGAIVYEQIKNIPVQNVCSNELISIDFVIDCLQNNKIKGFECETDAIRDNKK